MAVWHGFRIMSVQVELNILHGGRLVFPLFRVRSPRHKAAEELSY